MCQNLRGSSLLAIGQSHELCSCRCRAAGGAHKTHGSLTFVARPSRCRVLTTIHVMSNCRDRQTEEWLIAAWWWWLRANTQVKRSRYRKVTTDSLPGPSRTHGALSTRKLPMTTQHTSGLPVPRPVLLLSSNTYTQQKSWHHSCRQTSDKNSPWWLLCHPSPNASTATHLHHRRYICLCNADKARHVFAT